MHLTGFSRGGTWALQIATTLASAVDSIWAIAPYPVSKDERTQIQEARAVLKCPVPVTILQLDEDFLAPPTDVQRSQTFQVAMTNAPGSALGQRTEKFKYVYLHGDRETGCQMLENWDDFSDYPRVDEAWNARRGFGCFS